MSLNVLLIVLALVATGGALLLGLMSMGQGSYIDRTMGGPLMWLRVGLQATAVVLLALFLYLR